MYVSKGTEFIILQCKTMKWKAHCKHNAKSPSHMHTHTKA
jgi:hypothetical protein